MAKKQRLDTLLVEKGFFQSREKAKTSIMAGLVLVNNQRIDKAGTDVNVDAEIKVQGNAIPFVSRGGLKLDKALKVFPVTLTDKVVMDIGASTGGFTDCALQNGARKVYAVDVGYGQLAWTLRQDSRVVNLERTNIRYLTKDQITDNIDFITIDVSFISLSKVLPKAFEFGGTDVEAVVLVKPQFEAGKELVGKRGVVRDPKVHMQVIEKIVNEVLDIGLVIKGVSYSPVKGPEGNIEYLLYIGKDGEAVKLDIKKVVQEAHNDL